MVTAFRPRQTLRHRLALENADASLRRCTQRHHYFINCVINTELPIVVRPYHLITQAVFHV
eukprot:1178753-Prorocentrum_minimum.AAC.3